MPLSRKLGQTLAHLHPGYFALVMATGIVSIGAVFQHQLAISRGLLWFGFIGYAVLLVAYLLRAAFYWPYLRADLLDPERTFTLLTFVAGTAVLGVRLLLGQANPGLTMSALLLAGSFWVVLLYVSFGSLILRTKKPELGRVVNGGWHLAIVATQSMSILSTLEAATHHAGSAAAADLLVAGYAFWGVGIIMYLVFITFVIQRLFFGQVLQSDLASPYWINMGAMAITTLAGARLLQEAPRALFLAQIAPFIAGLSLALWAWGTWWVPLLFLITFRRYLVPRRPIIYEPPMWSMVFPMGMYSVASYQLGLVTGIPLLRAMAGPAWWVAISAWTLVTLAMFWAWVNRTSTTADPSLTADEYGRTLEPEQPWSRTAGGTL